VKKNQRNGVMKGMATIDCVVLLGMFSSERQVIITLPSGQEIDALVDYKSVNVDQDPKPGESVRGSLKVSLIDYDKRAKQALIDLPQGNFTSGPRIQVPWTMVKEAR
jgi:hypothetical protein